VSLGYTDMTVPRMALHMRKEDLSMPCGLFYFRLLRRRYIHPRAMRQA